MPAPDDTRETAVAAQSSAVAVRVPAEATHLTLLRAVAEAVSHIADFGVDAVTDIRLALDEVAMAFVLSAVPGTEVVCEFSYDEQAMTVRVHAVCDTAQALDVHRFGWHVLNTLADSVAVSSHPYSRALAGFPIEVTFTRARLPDL
ncbi:anti-sigma factor [Nocardia sp. 2]|uniref:Anti-sigma factor n=1 Tax=Nocardia acididurans TaxID=2802282 RepID=A0ABS1M6W7_9NOCA|nr:anti-sigma factor [Nocardia acididurans]MBL1076397.1 anti-sigma factor [Nocardia acididurans]